MNDEDFITVCRESVSMAEAASKVKMHYNTFKKRALKLGCYLPNPAGKGTSKPKKPGKYNIPLEEILDGKHPQYQTFKLKKKLFLSGLKNNICENCQIEYWQGKKIQCELHHIDGDRTNHLIVNLQILCPNCHSQTGSFRAKNIGRVT